MKRLTKQQFVERANRAHDKKYNYSKAIYKNNKTKIIIICEKHGEFEQFPMDHMKKDGCPKCSKNRHSITKEFIEKAQKVHNNSSFSFYFL